MRHLIPGQFGLFPSFGTLHKFKRPGGKSDLKRAVVQFGIAAQYDDLIILSKRTSTHGPMWVLDRELAKRGKCSPCTVYRWRRSRALRKYETDYYVRPSRYSLADQLEMVLECAELRTDTYTRAAA